MSESKASQRPIPLSSVIKKAFGLTAIDAQEAQNAALEFAIRHKRTGSPDDLDKAITTMRRAINLTGSKQVQQRVKRLYDLGRFLASRYEAQGEEVDVVEAIQVTRQAIPLISPKDIPDKADAMTNLGELIAMRHKNHEADLTDLEEAIKVLGGAHSLHADAGPSLRARRLGLLGIVMGQRYSGTNSSAHLEQTIHTLQKAIVDATMETKPDRNKLLDQLSHYLTARSIATGNDDDLHTAMRLLREALTSGTEDTHPRLRWGRLRYLGDLLQKMHTRTGLGTDLDDAIWLHKRTLEPEFAPERSFEQAAQFYNLGTLLKRRWDRYHHERDLEEAIQAIQRSVDLSSEGSVLHEKRLSCLKGYIAVAGADDVVRTDVQVTIQTQRDLLHATQEDHPDRSSYVFALARALSKTKTKKGFEEAMELKLTGLALLPEHHPQRASHFLDLAWYCMDQHALDQDPTHIQNAVGYGKLALQQRSSMTRDRILAGKHLVEFCAMLSDWEGACDAAITSVDLISRLVPRSLADSDKQFLVTSIVGLASDAAALALQTQKSPEFALDILERGRSVLTTTIRDLRTDLMDLQTSNPQLAERFVKLRKCLQQVSDDTDAGIERTQSDQYAQIGWRHDVKSELDQLIEEIRGQEGFEAFLRPPTLADLRNCTARGPIVVVNVSRYRCDAILILVEEVRSLQLSACTFEELQRRSTGHRPGSHKDLKWLWDAIAKPILNSLGFVQPSCVGEDLPRIWWIPTGPLVKLPLHAAGHHTIGSTESVLDRVISSYSTSLRALVMGGTRVTAGRKRRNEALLIGMGRTPGHTQLHSVEREIAQVSGLCRSMGLDPILPGRRKQEVISHLPFCQIFHFAGHGSVDNNDPSKSFLLLNDWQSSSLTVATLMSVNIGTEAPLLAYLSACGTGQTGHDDLADEGLHLMSACQLSGFRHVIGTLWEVNDDTCVEMARITYETIRAGIMEDDAISLGLHKASTELRKRWLDAVAEMKSQTTSSMAGRESPRIGSRDRTNNGDDRLENQRVGRDVVLCEDSGDEDEESMANLVGLMNWVPYVHFGN